MSFTTRTLLRLGLIAASVPLLWVSGCGSDGRGETFEDIGEIREPITTCPPGFDAAHTFIGTNGPDNIVGTPEADCIIGLGGDDTINGLGGDDYIAGGAGNDVLIGGDGSDTIFGEGGDDDINGGAGNDNINGGVGNDIIRGGAGVDTIRGLDGDDQLFGGADNDDIRGGSGADTIDGEGGNDYIEGNAGNDVLNGGPGADIIHGNEGDDQIHGNDGDDSVFGEAGNDTIRGGMGNDTLRGDDGDDVIFGDDGDDTIYGFDGNDTLHGGPGNDVLRGGPGVDQIFGNDGDDRLVGGLDADTLTGGPGNDLANEGGHGGTVIGNAGNDAMVLASGDGGNGTDACSGTSCELPEPPAFCTANVQCASRRCATEVNICIYCQSNSECPAGQECVPTLGCRAVDTTELVCDDGIDNDGDGLTDCEDTDDCSTASNCQFGNVSFAGGGDWHNCFTSDDGVVKCWGRNNCGQVGFTTGVGANAFSSTPGIVNGLSSPLLVRGGAYSSCALEQGGTVKCWGSSSDGRLGDGGVVTGDCRMTPVAVAGISNATQIWVGGSHACALDGGQVKCWGDNQYGQLGNGTTTDSNVPVPVVGLTNVKAIAAGNVNTCALLNDATVRCWGRNNQGQLGNGTMGGFSATPVQVSGLTGVAQISVGQAFACAVTLSGNVRCWGGNAFGQLGVGNTTNSAVPLQLSLTAVRRVDLRAFHACAIRGAGQVVCWGENRNGQVGNGTISNAVTTPVSTVPLINDATSMALGRDHTCIRRANNTVTCWGDNRYGQIATDVPNDHPSPTTRAGIP